MNRPLRLLLVLLLSAFVSLPTVLLAQEEAAPERLTVEWIYGDGAREARRSVSRAWIADGTALLYDQQREKEERTIESLDPATGERKPAIDRDAVVASMTEVLGTDPEEPLEEPGWPSSFDRAGRRALYSKKGDLFVLELATSKLRRLTETEGAEKSARFSPDGNQIAFVRDNDLYVVDVESGEEKRLTHDGSDTLLNGTLSWVYWEELFGRRDRAYVWSPDSRSIVYLQSDDAAVHVMRYVDFKPGEPRVVRQRYPKAGGVNPRVRAGVVDVEGAKTTWIDLGAYPYEYLQRVQWLPDGKRLAVRTMDRSQQKLDIFLADAATGEASHLLREVDEGWITDHEDLHFFADGEHFLWVSERDGYAHLYLYTMDGELVRQVTRGEWALRGGARGWADGLRYQVAAIDEEAGVVYFMAREKSAIEGHLYKIRLDGTGMERLTREDGTHSIAFSPDGRSYFDSFSSLTAPPSVVLRDVDGKDVATLREPSREVAERFGLGTVEHFTLPAADGFELPALLLKPKGFEPGKRYPALISVYGGPAAPRVRNSWGGLWEHLLAQEGFVVFTIDPRSSTAISKKLTNLILHDGYHGVEKKDLKDGVQWLKSQPYVDPERVGIYGWSGGGATTLLMMTTCEEFRAGIAGAPVTDWHYYDTVYTEAFMKRPIDNPEGYEATSNALRAKDLHGRLLIIHGTYDDNVNPQNTWHFVDELIEADILFDMMIYPMRKHGFRDQPARIHVRRTMLDFWKRNMKP